jgi:NADH:ubiquinone oxidoreductase subunit E
MENPQAEIVICMGSSCFSRGNKNILSLIQEYLSDNGLKDQVVFRGAHCFGQCEHGPMLKINDTLFQNLDPNKLAGILDRFFTAD